MKNLTFLALFLLATTFSFAEESFAGAAYDVDSFAVEASLAEERFAAEKSFDEERFVEKVISSSGLVFLDKHVEKMTVKELRDRYEGKYDIDWVKVAAKFGAGAAIIVITGTVSVVAGATGAEPVAAIAFASCKGAAIGAISGAVVGGGLGGLIEALKSGNLSTAQKGAIESAADGFMWGAAIGAVTGGWGAFKAKSWDVVEQGVRNPEAIPKGNFKVSAYVDNGATYVGDDLHRVKYFSAKNLKLTNGNPRNSIEPKIGKELKCGVGGHLLANRFGGTGGYENLVSMSKSANKAFSELENTWAQALKEGKKVSVSGDIRYIGSSRIPTEFIIRYIINGKTYTPAPIPNLCP